jgi:hypothetical protein
LSASAISWYLYPSKYKGKGFKYFRQQSGWPGRFFYPTGQFLPGSILLPVIIKKEIVWCVIKNSLLLCFSAVIINKNITHDCKSHAFILVPTYTFPG